MQKSQDHFFSPPPPPPEPEEVPGTGEEEDGEPLPPDLFMLKAAAAAAAAEVVRGGRGGGGGESSSPRPPGGGIGTAPLPTVVHRGTLAVIPLSLPTPIVMMTAEQAMNQNRKVVVLCSPSSSSLPLRSLGLVVLTASAVARREKNVRRPLLLRLRSDGTGEDLVQCPLGVGN